MKASDLREKSVEDLRELEKNLAHGVFDSRLKNFTNRLDDTSAMRKGKRDLARVLTLLRQREIAAAQSASAVVAIAPVVATPAPEVAPKPVAEVAVEAEPKKKATKKSSPKKGEAK